MHKLVALLSGKVQQIVLASLIAVIATNNVEASSSNLRFASIFNDHMVLQRDKPIRIWGWSDAGSPITVTFAGQSKSTTAESDGKWMITLDPLPANEQPQMLTVQSRNGEPALKIEDVLVGEVWLASGQSNMEWSMAAKEDSKQDIPNADQPLLRIIKVPLMTALVPQANMKGTWARCSPQSVGGFSSVAYYYGLRLQKELHVPFGMIESAWGGTAIEPWTSLDGFEAVPALKDFAALLRKQIPSEEAYRNIHQQHRAAVEKWLKAQTEALAHQKPVPPMPMMPPTLPNGAGSPTAINNAMIQPLLPLTLRGAIWYQGESNHGEGLTYVHKTNALQASWRRGFQNPEMPFYFVQIAPHQYGSEDAEILPQFWVAQRECLRLPFTGMAVITDLGEIADIHPARKKEVADRLALWALANDYGRKEIDPNGPLYKSHQIEGNAIRVRFEHTAGSLASRDGKELTHFELAGKDGVFHPAKAELAGESVIVRAEGVPAPRRVRFGWSKLAMPNLMNKSGLSACAFHSHWPIDPDLGENLALGHQWECSDPNVWGWNAGLTDGNWNVLAPNCFATGNADVFPKYVTVDLKRSQPLNLVKFGVPQFGSTKTVAISISEDGKAFHEVGVHVFRQNRADAASIVFPDSQARFVRLTYKDFHNREVGGFSRYFGFTTELEVYHSR